MSRTVKDLPYWLWQAERLAAPYPPSVDGPYRSGPSYWDGPAVNDAWYALFPIDPAVRSQKARRRSSHSDRNAQERRYRAYVRDRIAHGDYDSIEAPAHLSGYLWWW